MDFCEYFVELVQCVHREFLSSTGLHSKHRKTNFKFVIPIVVDEINTLAWPGQFLVFMTPDVSSMRSKNKHPKIDYVWDGQFLILMKSN
jgi:hypothetical protein